MSGPNGDPRSSERAALTTRTQAVLQSLPEQERGVVWGIINSLGIDVLHPNYPAFLDQIGDATLTGMNGVERTMAAYETQIVLGGNVAYQADVPINVVLPSATYADTYDGQFAERESPTGLPADFYGFAYWRYHAESPGNMRGVYQLEFVRMRHNIGDELHTVVFARTVRTDTQAGPPVPAFRRMDDEYDPVHPMLRLEEHRFARAAGPADNVEAPTNLA